MPVKLVSLPNSEEEVKWIVSQIKSLSTESQEIAIIARKHKQLEQIARLLQEAGIFVAYERKENVLDLPHINWIVNIFRYIHTIDEPSQRDDSLLKEILCYPFWNIDSLVIYDLSLKVFAENKTAREQNANKKQLKELKGWLEIMLEYKCSVFDGEQQNEKVSQQIQNIAQFLIELAKQSKVLTAEQMLDWIMGVNQEGNYQLSYNTQENQEPADEE